MLCAIIEPGRKVGGVIFPSEDISLEDGFAGLLKPSAA
jgi:hypothetical protein